MKKREATLVVLRRDRREKDASRRLAKVVTRVRLAIL